VIAVTSAISASEAAGVRIEDYRETPLGHRVLHLLGRGSKPATMPPDRHGAPDPRGLPRRTHRRTFDVGSPTSSEFISSIWAFIRSGIFFFSPARASASLVQ
jgi:hypothetical protein